MHFIQYSVHNYIVSCSFFNVLYIINAYIHLDKALIFRFCMVRHLCEPHMTKVTCFSAVLNGKTGYRRIRLKLRTCADMRILHAGYGWVPITGSPSGYLPVFMQLSEHPYSF